MGDVSIKMYDKFGHVLRIESTCNDIGTFRVKRKVEHRDGSSSEQKAPLKKSIYSLYQLFTIMKAANYRYLEFISSFDGHSGGNSSLTKVTSPVIEKERSYRGINFFSEQDLRVLETISRGEYMTFGMQGKTSAHIWETSVPQPCPESLNVSDCMESLNVQREPISIFPLYTEKRSLLQVSLSKISYLYQHWHRCFFYAEILPFCAKNHL